jgi:hypothetical protein
MKNNAKLDTSVQVLSMRDPSFAPERRPRKVRIWHFAVATAVASVIFAGIKALARPSADSWLEIVLAFLSVWILACSGLIFVSVGARLGDRATKEWKAWGIARGGIEGFLAFTVGLLVNMAIALGITALGATLIISLFFLLFRSAT